MNGHCLRRVWTTRLRRNSLELVLDDSAHMHVTVKSSKKLVITNANFSRPMVLPCCIEER